MLTRESRVLLSFYKFSVIKHTHILRLLSAHKFLSWHLPKTSALVASSGGCVSPNFFAESLHLDLSPAVAHPGRLLTVVFLSV